MLTSNAVKVLERRYLLKDKNGNIIESPDQLFRRVAKAIASVEIDTVKEYWEELFYEAMSNLKFLPNTPTLMNAGTENGQLSACFTIGIQDSIEGIFDAVKWSALIQKTGGGVGYCFSKLRQKGSMVKKTSGVSSGPVSFMQVFNAMTESIKQGGKRRGAQMAVLHCWHPDILEFIDCKQDLTQLTNFNISVAITDEFMDAYYNNKNYNLYDPKEFPDKFIKIGELSARLVFDKIINNAWSTGEPGIIFIDEMNRKNPGRNFETIFCTNPCGEICMPDFDACNLLSINVEKFVNQSLSGFDEELLKKYINTAIRMLDNIIDINHYPITQIKEQNKKSRRIGLGIMGWADALIKLGIPYDSEKALDLGNRLMKFIYISADEYSKKLGQERGTVYNLGRRNTVLTMIAPTGTISIIAGCSSGIEPIYAVSYIRNVMDKTKLIEVNPEFKRIAQREGFYSEELMDRISKTNSIQQFSEIPEHVKKVFKTSADISTEYHVKMQAVFQKYCDSAVSKTINLPSHATKEDVKKSYLLAHQLECKGVTVYRDGSRPGQVLSTGKTPQKTSDGKQIGVLNTVENGGTGGPWMEDDCSMSTTTTLPRPVKLKGFTDKIKTGYGNLYVTVNSYEGQPFELFASIGKSGFSTMADTEAISRLISLAFRNKIHVSEIIKQIRGIGGSQPILGSNGLVSSIPDAIAKILEINFLKKENEHISFGFEKDIHHDRCPDCEEIIQHKEGCLTCENCGYSKC